MQVYNNRIITPVAPVANNKKVQNQINTNSNTTTTNSFQDILNNEIDSSSKLQFSKHASMRLSARNVNLSDEQILRVEEGVKKANSKGINDSLVLVDDIALVVNVKNRVVITAMNQENSNENVFTNIDGAVIV